MAGRQLSPGDRVATSIRLPRDLLDRLTEEAEWRDLSVNYLITKAVSRYLAGLKPLEDDA